MNPLTALSAAHRWWQRYQGHYQGNVFWRTVLVAQMTVIAFVVFWAVSFPLRILERHHELGPSYYDAVVRDAKCRHDAETRTSFFDQCKEAKHLTLHSLWYQAFWATWHESHMCGSVSCTDAVFGHDSTFAGVLIKVAVVGGLFLALILLSSWLLAAYDYAIGLLPWLRRVRKAKEPGLAIDTSGPMTRATAQFRIVRKEPVAPSRSPLIMDYEIMEGEGDDD